jgi:hypothetical protein
MGIAKLNIWVSDVADPCGTWKEDGEMTILDCKGILEWPCGRFLAPHGQWEPVPNGRYHNLPFRCGHLEVEVPPGCYWVVSGIVKPSPEIIYFNYTTHVGIAQVGCDETACVKLYNPTTRLCWEWFRVGLRMLAVERSPALIDPGKVDELEGFVEELLQDAPRLPIEEVIRGVFEGLIKSAWEQR